MKQHLGKLAQFGSVAGIAYDVAFDGAFVGFRNSRGKKLPLKFKQILAFIKRRLTGCQSTYQLIPNGKGKRNGAVLTVLNKSA